MAPARRSTPSTSSTPRGGRVLEIAPDRFLTGVHRLGVFTEVEPEPDPGSFGDEVPISIDVVRARDLVAFRVEAYGCQVVGGRNPLLQARDAEGHLVFRFTYQHLGEEAQYEGDPDIPIPIRARPSRSSRIVVGLPPGNSVPFTSEGLLQALGRLRMVVHPLARPGLAPVDPASGGRLVLTLPGGLQAVVGDLGLVVRPAPKSAQVDAGTVAGLQTQLRGLRLTRSVLATTPGTVERVSSPPAPAEDLVLGIGDRRLVVPSLFATADAGGLVVTPVRPPRPFRRPTFSRPPHADETAIEAPYRLVISPDDGAGWAHADTPVEAEGDADRVELWHTRLGRRPTDSGGHVIAGPTDERFTQSRIVRAIWARDRERYPDPLTPPRNDMPLQHDDLPFPMSLDGQDRTMLVRQTAETWLGLRGKLLPPTPAAARSLWLSALGSWLELHGVWDTADYSAASLSAILAWDHIAPMGRDQFVQVVYPGYLYPFGHKAALVKQTERRLENASPSVARLYQRMFIVVGEPTKRYAALNLPFQEVRLDPLVTPTIQEPSATEQKRFFWPTTLDGSKFRWVWHTVDAERRPVRLVAPLVWVAEAFSADQAERDLLDAFYAADPDSTVTAGGQHIAFAEARSGGDTVVETVDLTLAGKAAQGTSTPQLDHAQVTHPAVQQLARTGPLKIAYAAVYTNNDNGFGAAANGGEVWAEVVGTVPKLEFGGGSAPSGSDKAGGFVTPTVPIAGLSRLSGPVGDVASMAAQSFDPVKFLRDNGPMLFGIIPLIDLILAVDHDLLKAPNVVSQALGRIEGFLADLAKVKEAAERAAAEAQAQVDRTVGRAQLHADAVAALGAASALESQVTAAVDAVVAAVGSLVQKTEAEIELAMAAPLDALRDAVTQIDAVAPQLTPLARNELLGLAKVLKEVLAAADLLADLVRTLHGLGDSSVQARFRMEWRPRVGSWPSPDHPFLGIEDPIFVPKNADNCLVLAIDGRASGKGEMGVEVLAELRDFTLKLLPGASLVNVAFDHLSFHASSAGKTDVDVVLEKFEFVGILGFVEKLRDLIPFDGFSDPPFLDVSAKGLSAGFTLALPSVAVGVFALTNISLGADLQVPFLGGELSVGFNFCSRERPFTLQVTFIGGGGWFLLRISPKGLAVLEVGLEAGATLSVDLVVASGSVSAMVGVYLRLEGTGGSLTAYFRLRGEVNVLGLISASIELYLELHYVFDTGKLVGRASLTIEIDIFFISIPVTITCERQFAGSKGDPSFRELMAVVDGASDPWDEYCLAFVGA